jgi:hypothetical protein
MIGVRVPAGAGNFSLLHRLQNGSGATRALIQWVPRDLPLGVKLPGLGADHSPPSSAEIRNAWSYTSTPPIHLNGVVIDEKAQGQLYLYLYGKLNMNI